MTLQYINKDITTVSVGMIAHGTNCAHGFGSGIAGAIRRKWPQVYNQYMSQPKGKRMLGKVDVVFIDDTLAVANCYTQEYYGRDGAVYADIDAVNTAIDHVAHLTSIYSLPALYMPKIGCGLGGLDWETEVEPIVQRVADTHDHIDIIICDIFDHV